MSPLLQSLHADELTDSKEDEFMLRRLDAGLFVLQLIDYVMIDVSSTGPNTVSLISLISNASSSQSALIALSTLGPIVAEIQLLSGDFVMKSKLSSSQFGMAMYIWVPKLNAVQRVCVIVLGWAR